MVNDRSEIRLAEDAGRQNIAFNYLCEPIQKVGESDDEVTDQKWFDLDKLPPLAEIAFDHYQVIQTYLGNPSAGPEITIPTTGVNQRTHLGGILRGRNSPDERRAQGAKAPPLADMDDRAFLIAEGSKSMIKSKRRNRRVAWR